MRRLLIPLLAFALGAGLSHWAPWRPPAPASQDVRRLALVREENDRLRTLVEAAEKSRALEKNKAQREAIEREVVEIRGLPFKKPVAYELLDRSQIKAVLSKKLADVFSEEEFANMTAGLARLGLVEAEYPLRQKYIDLLGEQVAAFYDQHAHKLFMFEDATLENAQNRVVLAHELTHALQDQHFGLQGLPLEIKTNDDRALAASSLCEGDATLVMSEYMLKHVSLDTLKSTVAGALTQNMDQLSKAPRYLRETLVFPYLRGQEFCAALHDRGGYEALNAAYRHLPASSAQILHPEKYLAAPREEPVAVQWPDLTVRGQKPIADNVLGEMGVRILLSQWTDDATGEAAATGWRGDRYLCFENSQALVWKTLWADAQEAAAFVAAQERVWAKRYAGEPRVTRCVVLRETEVLVIDAAAEPWAAALQEKFGR